MGQNDEVEIKVGSKTGVELLAEHQGRGGWRKKKTQEGPSCTFECCKTRPW